MARSDLGDPDYHAQAVVIVENYLASGRQPQLVVPAVLVTAGEAEKAFRLMEENPYIARNAWNVRLWGKSGKRVRQHPGFQGYAKRNGLLDYWREFGWPDVCRPVHGGESDAFECE